MLKQDSLLFLEELNQNNHKEWFTENKPRFIELSKNFREFVQNLIEGIAQFDESVEKQDAKNCIFRIYKDVRFSKDKIPYKTNFGAAISGKGKGLSQMPGYYIHIEPGNCFLAGGIYMSESDMLKKIRKHISENSAEFMAIIQEEKFKNNFRLGGEKLKNVPQGFEKEDPMAEFLKHKSFVGIHNLGNKEIVEKDFLQKSIGVYQSIFPYNQFLHQAVHL